MRVKLKRGGVSPYPTLKGRCKHLTYYEEKLKNGEIKETDEWLTFNGFCFPMLPGVRYFMDGRPGNGRTLFIEDEAETFEISFEVGMQCLDLLTSCFDNSEHIDTEYSKEGKYLHQCKTKSKLDENEAIIYFHFEIPDSKGEKHTCPGQMFTSVNYKSTQEPEPVLVEILNSVFIVNK